MRRVTQLALILLIAHAVTLHAEDADEVREKGIAALKDAQTNPHAIVEAARLFVKAAALYGDAGNEEKNVEMNSFLYWCKKKMTLEDIEQFTKGGEAAVTSKLAAVEKAAPKADEAQKWFDRADQFAQKNPNEHLLIAIRFFEVADRFKGSDASLTAQDRSLKEMLQEKSSTVKTVPQPATNKPPETVANDNAKRPVPLPDDLKLSEHLIKDLFKAEYAVTDAASRRVLIAKLLQQADENKNDAASVYVLLHDARDIAVAIGESERATEAQNKLLDAFKIDFAAAMIDLRKLEPTAKTAEAASTLATLFSLEANNAFTAGDYENAVRFNARVEDLLPIIKDAALQARFKEEISRVQAIKRESVAALAAQKTLATKPDDPDANLIAGKFALLLGDMEKSMAMLAKSKDGVLSGLAKREISPPQDATQQTVLADDWFDRAAKEASPNLKARMQDRAALWYTSALPGLAGLAKLKVEGRIKMLPPDPTGKTAKFDVVFEPGWSVFFDGKLARNSEQKRMVTPCTINAPSGTHDIALAKDGFRDIHQNVIVRNGIAIEVTSKPLPGASALLSSMDILPDMKPFHEGMNVRSASEGVELSGSDNIKLVSETNYSAPTKIVAVVKTNSQVRFYCGPGEIIFGWEVNPTEFRYHDISTGGITAVKGKGNIVPNVWHTITWMVQKDGTTIQLDGKEMT